MSKNAEGRVEIRERRWEYIGNDMYIKRDYRNADGSASTTIGSIRWYNRWFIKFMNRNKHRRKRTLQQIMDEGGIVRMSSPGSNITYVNTKLIQKHRQEERK